MNRFGNFDTTKTKQCPPLSQNEVLNLRGKPAAKIALEQDVKTPSIIKELWVYISPAADSRESFLFQKGVLIGWHKTERALAQKSR